MKKSTNIILMPVIIVAIVLLINGFSSPGKNKIAFVKSQYLIEEYHGTKDARKRFMDRELSFRIKIDSLNTAVNLIRKEMEVLWNGKFYTERQNKLNELDHAMKLYQNTISGIQNMAMEEEEKMMQGVLNQINEHVLVFGKSHGYDLILGTNDMGSILYGEDAIDITDEILLSLNTSYHE